MRRDSNAGSPSRLSQDCWTWLNALQLGVGALLVTASAHSYSIMQQPILLVPAIMGAALLFFGGRAFMVCHDRPLLGDRHHPSSGAAG